MKWDSPFSNSAIFEVFGTFYERRIQSAKLLKMIVPNFMLSLMSNQLQMELSVLLVKPVKVQSEQARVVQLTE